MRAVVAECSGEGQVPVGGGGGSAGSCMRSVPQGSLSAPEVFSSPYQSVTSDPGLSSDSRQFSCSHFPPLYSLWSYPFIFFLLAV